MLGKPAGLSQAHIPHDDGIHITDYNKTHKALLRQWPLHKNAHGAEDSWRDSNWAVDGRHTDMV